MLENANLVAIAILALGGTMLVRFMRHVFGSYMAPASIYVGLWCFSLAVFYTGIVYYNQLEWPTILVFLYAGTTFVIGALIAKRLVLPAAPSIPEEIRQRGLEAVIYILFGVGVVGFIGYYLKLHQLIGIESLWANPRLVRYEETLGELRQLGWVSLARSLLTPCFVFSILWLSLNGQGRHKWPIRLIAALSLLSAVPYSGRTALIGAVVWGILAGVYVSRLKVHGSAPRKLVLGTVIVAAIGIGYFLATTAFLQKDIDQSGASYSAYGQSAAPAGLVSVVHYTASSFPAFQELMNGTTDPKESGSLTFGVIARVLHEISPTLFEMPDYVQPFVYVPLSTNVYTYLDAYFQDFGWIGIVLLPFITSLIVTGVFLWTLNAPSVAKVYSSSLLGLCVLESTIGNRFGSFETWAWILLPIGLLKLVQALVKEKPSPGVQIPKFLVKSVRV